MKERIKKNTLGMFDCLKGLIILFVVLVHCHSDIMYANPQLSKPILMRIFENLPGIAMSLLFVMSGYSFKPTTPVKALKKQSRLLLKPYWLVAVTITGLVFLLNLLTGQGFLKGLLSYPVSFLLGFVAYFDFHGLEIVSIQSVWYLLALFWAWMLLTLIYQVKSQRIQRIIVIFCVAAGVGISFYFRIFPFCILQALAATGFLYMGYRLKKNQTLFREIAPGYYVAAGIVFAFCLVAGDVNMGTNGWKLGYLDYIGMLCGCFIILRLYLWFYRPDWKIYRIINYFGENSLLLLCIHTVEHNIFFWKESPLIRTETYAGTFLMLYAVRLVIIVIVAEIVRRINKYFRRKIK